MARPWVVGAFALLPLLGGCRNAVSFGVPDAIARIATEWRVSGGDVVLTLHLVRTAPESATVRGTGLLVNTRGIDGGGFSVPVEATGRVAAGAIVVELADAQASGAYAGARDTLTGQLLPEGSVGPGILRGARVPVAIAVRWQRP
jgi:hypothetical protein